MLRDRAWVVDVLLLAAAGVGGLIVIAAAVGRLPGGLVVTRHLPHGDLLVHALVYGTLAAAATVLVPRPVVRMGRRVRCPLALLVVLLLAFGEEALQMRDPARQASVHDAAADTIGVLGLAPLLLLGRARARDWLAASSRG